MNSKNYENPESSIPIENETYLHSVYYAGLISKRAYNVCMSLQLETIEELVEYIEEHYSLNGIPNCGLKTKGELANLVKLHEYSRKKTFSTETLPSNISNLLEESFNSVTSVTKHDNEEVLLAFRETFPTYDAFFILLMKKVESLMDKIRKTVASAPVAYRFLMISVDVCNLTIAKLTDTELCEDNDTLISFKEELIKKTEQLRKSIETKYKREKYDNELSAAKKKLLDSEYKNLLAKVKTIVQNFARLNYPTFFEALNILDIDYLSFSIKHGNKRKSSFSYYHYVLTPFRRRFEEIIICEDDNNAIVRAEFPFLTEKGISFVVKFKSDYGHYPYLHIIFDFIKHHPHRDAEMYRQKHGVSTSDDVTTCPVDMDVIGKKFSLTRERVRQITLSPAFLRQIEEYINPPINLHRYEEKSHGVCFPKSRFYLELVQREELLPVFKLFAEVYSLYFDYKIVDKYNHLYIVRPHLQHIVGTLVSKIHKLKKTKYSTTTLINIKEILSENDTPENIALQTKLLTAVIAPSFGIKMQGEDNMVFEKNCCDVELEAEMALRKAGAPMHLDDIIREICREHPDNKLRPNTFKYILQRSEKICSIGKTSRYSLREWTHVFTGSIRDAIRLTLKHSIHPLSIAEITTQVRKYFPSVSEKSIHASMFQSDEFTVFNKSLYGLNAKKYPENYIPTGAGRAREPFSKRFEQYKNFVETHGRHPFKNNATFGDTEISLARWKDNVCSGKINVEEREKSTMLQFLEKNSHLPHNNREQVFLSNCRKFAEMVLQQSSQNGSSTNNHLQKWFNKVRHRYTEFNDNRCLYFEDLLRNLHL